jgi:hypothetical protein
LVCVDPQRRIKRKNRQRAGGFVRLVLFDSAPPDRLQRGIKAAKEEQLGRVHGQSLPKALQACQPLRNTMIFAVSRPYNPFMPRGREKT